MTTSPKRSRRPKQGRRPQVWILGTGSAADHLAAALAGRGHAVLIWGRRHRRARRLAKRHGLVQVDHLADGWRELEPRGVVLLAVSDPAISCVAEQAARALVGSAHGRVALHVSGARPLEDLTVLQERGLRTGSMHPLVALAGRGTSRSFHGRWFSVAGEKPARRRAERLVRSVGGHGMRLLSEESRERYHASAALLATGLVALLETSRRSMASELERSQAARPALVGLAKSVLANLERLPAEDALTGPIARGDADMVSAHLSALEVDAGELYRAMGRVVADWSDERGRLRDSLGV